MNDNDRQTPWIDGAGYNRNRNLFPADQLQPYAGQHGVQSPWHQGFPGKTRPSGRDRG